jgi:hypothetical protein
MASESSSDKNIRKAQKKLREIEALKSRTDRNAQENEKIEKETFYKRVLDPSYRTEEEKEQEKRRYDILQKERDAMKRRQCANHEKKQKKKLENEEKERKKRQEEERKRQERTKYIPREKEPNRKILYIDPLEQEYLSLLIENKNDNSKTFRKMSKKYHPDKNLDKKQWAEEKQKQLESIRSKYENRDLDFAN